MKKQIEEMAYKRISKRAMAGVKPIILHIECEAKCEPIFKRCEYCDLEKELLNRLADLEDKIESGELRKASDAAEEIFAEIIEALTEERITEEQKANSALEAQDTASYEVYSYAEDKLATIVLALNLYKKKYTEEGK